MVHQEGEADLRQEAGVEAVGSAEEAEDLHREEEEVRGEALLLVAVPKYLSSICLNLCRYLGVSGTFIGVIVARVRLWSLKNGSSQQNEVEKTLCNKVCNKLPDNICSIVPKTLEIWKPHLCSVYHSIRH